MSPSKDVYLVIGGSGFLGRHIVEQLLERGDIVSVLDIVQRYDDTPFYSADISEKDQVVAALQKSGATCIIHTASPHATLKDPALYWKVNVDGTKAIIAAAVDCKVRKLVFTSSAGVVFNGEDLIDVDERLPYPEVHMDAYNESKAKAEEAVLDANGKGGLLTIALRPAGIFGPGDRQAMSGFYKVYENGQTHFQIGDNTNLFDWTYVGNVAYAHLLAADKLETPAPGPTLAESSEKIDLNQLPTLNAKEEVIIYSPLTTVSATTGSYRIPTSAARPLGPYRDKPVDGDALLAAFHSSEPADYPRPVARTRYDAFSEFAVSRAKLHHPEVHPLQVAGQAFFITNGEPAYFWDFPRAVWHQLDAVFPGKRAKRSNLVLPRSVGMTAAYGAEWYGWAVGKEPTFTRFKVAFSCVNRWYNIEKARRVLGYEPQVGLEEGVRRTVDWWKNESPEAKAALGQ